MSLSLQMPGNRVPPFIFKQFFNEIGRDITICILLDWFTFYECGLALKKSKLSDDLKYSDEIKNEFSLMSDENFDPVLKYMQDLKNKDFADSHTLILRPDKLAEYIVELNQDNIVMVDFPDDIVTKEQWEIMLPRDPHFVHFEEICTEDNFKQLLDKAAITIPNVEFQSFTQFIQDKLIDIASEWLPIRNGYLSRLEDNIRNPHRYKDYKTAKKYLKTARDLLEDHRYSYSIEEAGKAIERALSIYF